MIFHSLTLTYLLAQVRQAMAHQVPQRSALQTEASEAGGMLLPDGQLEVLCLLEPRRVVVAQGLQGTLELLVGKADAFAELKESVFELK